MKRLLAALLALVLILLAPAAPAALDLFGRAGKAGAEAELLEPDQAFALTVTAAGAEAVRAQWTIAPGYYLYRERLRIALVDPVGVELLAVDTPPGEPKDDPYFGRQEVYHAEATTTVRLRRSAADAGVTLKLDYQGCNEPLGVCYPPISRTVALELPAAGAAPASPSAAATATPGLVSAAGPAPEAEQDRIARLLRERRFLALPLFFGFGLLLAFTPCVFPMVPILSGIIVGQGRHLTRGHAFGLSAVYVGAMALAYTLAGVLAARLGGNVQAAFQNPWVLGSFAALFVALAGSMFGFYDLQMPARWQARLADLSGRQRGGDYLGVAMMGLLSALIVGPCVAPPLVGVLAVIAGTGDTVLGASALFAMSLGMGVPLLAIGASAGHFLPRAGHWMDKVKAVFGVLLLGVALLLLDRLLPVALAMLLWAVLLIVCATYMGALTPVPHGAPGWRTLVRGLGLVLLIQGALLLIGVAAGGRDPLRPLLGTGLASGAPALPAPAFRPVKGLAELDAAIAGAGGRPVLLDLYADWCVSCKELERDTFPHPAVRAALAGTLLLRADVTANDAADQALLRRFGLYGPPALLLFGRDGREIPAARIVGFVPGDAFATHLGRFGEG
ncbi:thiol:disulfide interchange protein DsbD [Plasticicumulans lactativorans]|uniref:Thiol:disulfide interchange protein DsbD n=1 Tax=Plasticicumulans lactativorans TaxID=1133106 RepID=A0A4R2L6S8_9GAMM|nr:protein-disulfide reductase DsbD [Plasticicumulans lactativorans]TCO81631.1 thiol:disulfide interchange protein DsbD [Plasticicumulans lactativorans]